MKIQKEHLAEIERHLKADCWLEYEDFIQEMTDHYACALEEKLNAGIEWKEAIEEIDKVFGGRYGLTIMQDEYSRQQEDSIRGDYLKVFKSFFICFPNYLLVIVSFLAFYILSSNELISKEILIIVSILPMLAGLCSILLSGLHTKINKDKPFRLLFHNGYMTISFGTSSICLYNLFRNLMTNNLWVSINSTLMIVTVLICSQIIYDTYPILKKKQIA